MMESIVFSFDLWFSVACLLTLVLVRGRIVPTDGKVTLAFRLLESMFITRIGGVAIGMSAAQTLITALLLTNLMYSVDKEGKQR